MDSANKRSLLPISKYEDFEDVVKRHGRNVDEVLDVAVLLVEWIHSQRHLPKAKETYCKLCGFTARIFLRKKMSMERAKEFIDRYYSLKTLAPEYLLNRDPYDPQLMTSLEHFHFAAMPTLTDRTNRLYVGKILDHTFSPHMMTDWHKYAMMVADLQQWEDVCLGEEVVLDLGNVTLQHVAVLTPSVIKKWVICYLRGFLFRPYSYHLVNVPSYAEVIVNVLKSLLKPKIVQRLYMHTNEGYGTLHDHISPKYLPKDFGGDGPELKDMHEAWLWKVNSYRDWYLEQDNYMVEEHLRPGKPISHSDIFGMEGSFRQLTVD